VAALTFGRTQRATVGFVSTGAALCAATLCLYGLHLVGTDLLVPVLAVGIGAAAVTLLWYRRRLADALEIERFHSAVIASSPNACVFSDSAGRILEFNPVAERLFGLSRAGLGARFMSDLLAASEPEGNAIGGNVLERLGHTTSGEGRRQDGSHFPIEITVLRVGAGHDARYAAYIRDLTEQRRADQAQQAQQDRIHQSEKLNAMGSLLAGVAHELNNPLAILVTQATLLREKAPTPDVERRAERIHAAAQRAGRIVKTFLSMARQKPPVRVPIDVNAAVEAALELVGYGLRSAGIAVRRELSPETPLVQADPDLLGQVFAAVLINAQQALADQTEDKAIQVASRTEGDHVVVTVADNGCGIAEDVRAKIFEPYFTTKPAGAGTGIGLSVCRNIMAAHSGQIELLPPQGRGSVFEIRLPVLPKIEDEPIPKLDGNRLSILVIDDEVDVAQSLAELLDVFGHRPVVISSAVEAIERLKRERFDAVITDLRMPGMNGIAVQRSIRAIDPGLADRTVIMTGDTVMGSDQEIRREGASSELVLEKPFSAESLRVVLDRVRRR
jgi:PAS domain S-box-containing protein